MDQALLSKGVLELVGTFLLITVILSVTSKPDVLAVPAIGLALMVAIWIIGGKTGGHVNPVVSLAMLFKNPATFTLTMFVVYAVSQALGGLGAVLFYRSFVQ